MDLGWSTNPVESFRLFQGKVLDEYDRLVDEFGLEVVDAVGSITEQQRLVRAADRAARDTAEPRGDDPMTSPSDSARLRPTQAQRRDPGRPLLRPGHSRTCRSTAIPASSSPSRAPTASAAARRFSCCASGSRSRATASSKPAGRARR